MRNNARDIWRYISSILVANMKKEVLMLWMPFSDAEIYYF